jgi:hydrogenase maturation protein HypF
VPWPNTASLGPVIGVAYDGAGYGSDGASWGGEILVARYDGFDRTATFRPIRLAGGDKAIREVWRTALALLDDAFGGSPPLDSIPLFQSIDPSRVRLVRQMLAGGLNSPPAHGVGRYFDAFGAMVLGRAESRHEGQVASEWNFVADAGESGRYGFAIDDSGPIPVVDMSPAVREAVRDVVNGAAASLIAGRFHNTIAAATADRVRAAARLTGRLPVVLTGGCFQNALLAEALLHELSSDFDVFLNRSVPPGDGGVALGQALVADAVARTRI